MGALGRMLLAADLKKEERQLEKDARRIGRRGDFISNVQNVAKLGLMIGTGGTVNPATVGFLTGATDFVSGKIGEVFAPKAEITGGKFHKDTRRNLRKYKSSLPPNLLESTGKGIKAALFQKFKLGDKEAVSFKEGFSDSILGKGIAKLESQAIGKELVGLGESSIGKDITEGVISRGGSSIDYGSGINRLKTAVAKEDLASFRETPMFSSQSLRGSTYKPTIDQIAETPVMKNIFPEKIYRQSAGEVNRYNVINEMEDAGYSVSPGGGLPFGRGYIGDEGEIVRPPSQPDVAMDFGEDDYLTKGEQLEETAWGSSDKFRYYKDAEGNIVDNVNQSFKELQEYNAANRIKDPGFTDFDEASWAQGQNILDRVNRDRRVGELQASSAYYNRFYPNKGSSVRSIFEKKWR